MSEIGHEILNAMRVVATGSALQPDNRQDQQPYLMHQITVDEPGRPIQARGVGRHFHQRAVCIDALLQLHLRGVPPVHLVPAPVIPARQALRLDAGEHDELGLVEDADAGAP
jgi:hypothetical protein